MGFNDAFGTVYEGSFNFDDNRKVWNLILTAIYSRSHASRTIIARSLTRSVS